MGDIWDLKLEKNIDILASLNKQSIISIGFKAEMDRENAKTNAKNMLKNKNLNGVCLNILDENNTFGSDTNTVELILNNKSFDFSGEKLDISLKLLEVLQKEFTNE